jgi:hypothetical protein
MQPPDAEAYMSMETPMKTATSEKIRGTVPKKRQKHHSYDESVDEPAKLIEDEAVDIEEAVPLEENEPVEGADEKNNVGPTFEE